MKHPISASLVLAVLLLPTSALAQRPDRPGRSRPMEEQPRGLQLRAEGACEGYTLFTPLQSTSTYLIDLGGEVVHEWPSEYRPGNAVYLLENGNLLRCCHVTDNPIFRSGGTGGRIQEQAWDGTVLWNYSISDEKGLQHHDIEPLPNGNVLVISYEARTRQEAIDAGRDPRVVAQRRHRLDLPVHDLDDPVGHASLLHQLHHADDGGRHLLARLDDNAVAAHQRDRHRPHGHHGREVELAGEARRRRGEEGVRNEEAARRSTQYAGTTHSPGTRSRRRRCARGPRSRSRHGTP